MPQQPLHLAIIPDGNRRWAKKHMLLPWKGHEKSSENFRAIIDWCNANPAIGVLTVWVFSTENWKREKREVEKLMTMFETYLRNERQQFQKRKIRFLHSGRKDRLPESLRSLAAQVEEETKHFDRFTINMALDYGGQDEIVRAVQAIVSKNERTINERTIRSYMDHPELPDIDLIIRTSGEQRTSNFFLWQSTYSEWIFTEKLFPEFGTDDLAAAVEEYESRKRRFGS